MTTKTRPCPFCAHGNSVIKANRTRQSFAGPGRIYSWQVECSACGADGPSAIDEAGAVARWNVRNVQVDLFNEPTDARR
jgi:hypothetical protein